MYLYITTLYDIELKILSILINLVLPLTVLLLKDMPFTNYISRHFT